ncbi:MAG: hypothetical protein ACE5E9_10090 [Nitrospinaceae bacterium]
MLTASPPSRGPVTSLPPPALFILLGASNLARAYDAVVHCLTRCLRPRPVEFLSAMGPGRAYKARGGIFNITYPPIGSCGILAAAKDPARKAARKIALVTDIGNDIMYNVPVGEIIACLETLLRDFRALEADVFVTRIPVDLETGVTEFQFDLLRGLFFPHSPVGRLQAAAAVREINGFLRDAAGGRIHLLPDMKEFCGVDKIHFSLFHSHKAWSLVTGEMIRVLKGEPAAVVGRFSTAAALLTNLGRLAFCDLIPVRKKSPGFF